MIYGKYLIIHLERDRQQQVKRYSLVVDDLDCILSEFIESSTINVNAQRKALTARTTRSSNQQQSGTARGGGRGGSNRSKIRNWNARDD